MTVGTRGFPVWDHSGSDNCVWDAMPFLPEMVKGRRRTARFKSTHSSLTASTGPKPEFLRAKQRCLKRFKMKTGHTGRFTQISGPKRIGLSAQNANGLNDTTHYYFLAKNPAPKARSKHTPKNTWPTTRGFF